MKLLKENKNKKNIIIDDFVKSKCNFIKIKMSFSKPIKKEKNVFIEDISKNEGLTQKEIEKIYKKSSSSIIKVIENEKKVHNNGYTRECNRSNKQCKLF